MFTPADLGAIPFFEDLLSESSGDDDLGARWAADLFVIQGLLGHESVATTEIYTRLRPHGSTKRSGRWKWETRK